MKEFSKKIDIELEHKDEDNNITNNYIEKIENKYEISGNNKIIEEEDNDLREGKYEKFNIPSELKKTFIITSILFIVGSILIGIGFIEQIRQDVPGVSISMWTLGEFVLFQVDIIVINFIKLIKLKEMIDKTY